MERRWNGARDISWSKWRSCSRGRSWYSMGIQPLQTLSVPRVWRVIGVEPLERCQEASMRLLFLSGQGQDESIRLEVMKKSVMERTFCDKKEEVEIVDAMAIMAASTPGKGKRSWYSNKVLKAIFK